MQQKFNYGTNSITYTTLAVIMVFCLFLNAQTSQDTSIINLQTLKIHSFQTWKHRFGDKTEFSDVNYDDTSWESVSSDDMKNREAGIHWYRTSILLSGEMREFDNLALRISGLSMAYEVFWDDELISTNGKIHPEEHSEIPGNQFHTIDIKNELTTSGKHIIAFRVSNFQGKYQARKPLLSLSYSSFIKVQSKTIIDQNFLSIGIYLTAALFCISLFFGSGRHLSYIFFGLYCIIRFVTSLFNYSLLSSDISIPDYEWLHILQISGVYLYGLLLNVFFMFHLNISRKYTHTGIMGFLIILMEVSGLRFSYGDALPNSVMMIYALWLFKDTLKKRKLGDIFILVSIVIRLLFYLAEVYNVSDLSDTLLNPRFFVWVSEALLLTSVILSVSMKIKEQEKRFEALRLQSQRLETELLKKSIQPHFIMNTLLSIKSWIGKSAGKAENLIEALADEYRIISAIAAEKEIPLSEEISLCKHHLKVMGYRRDATYRLLVEKDRDDVKIPPMVLHTLIENGITHSYKPRENGTFRLSCTKNNMTVGFCLRNDGSKIAQLSQKKSEDGMGMKYVKARLEESYPGNWKLEYGMKDGLWEVNITINRKR